MKKVIIISPGLSGGGAERVATILANYLVQNNFKVTFICAYKGLDNFAYFLDGRVEVKFIEINAKNHLKKFTLRNFKIKKEVKAISPDVVITFIRYHTLLTALSGAPMVYTLRNDPGFIRKSKINWLLLSIEFAKAKKIVFQTKGAQAAFKDKIKKKSTIIANPLVTKDLPLWNSEDHKKVFVTACRLNEQKNIPMLVKAFIMVHSCHPDYSLEIYGDGDLKNEIINLIKENKAEDYIRLMGFSSDIHRIMAMSAGFVLSSDFEGLSNSMLEALCIGVPCICTDCPPGGAGEYIESGENGFLVNVGDFEDMAGKINSIIENKSLCQKFSQNAVRYRTILDVDAICKEWLEICNVF